MIDPVNDPAPRFSFKTLMGLGGWVASAAVAVSALTYADKMNTDADLARDRAQTAALISHEEHQQQIDGEQMRRLDKIEARQAQQDALLFDICAAVMCRGKAQ
ncbi:MAG: hypothetical protein B7Y35_06150 [Sphingomonadales bacterium 28-64-96]|nr:MAG: hypothetical protein B7Y35_06150 [Sphingomonadales bacterium 28-64-96]